ncbi:MAG: HAD-IA family hydrolase [Acidobacteriaceae bacterium]|nr:HAD-IA family hydrolase [Acidobacteriaceae bacterium]
MHNYDVPEAAVFDLDGVITFTARVHAAAWKELFDNYLRARSEKLGEPFKPFDDTSDYQTYVDGKPRYEGVLSFLRSRGIELPYGSPSDPPDAETICGLGNRKNDIFNSKVSAMGVDVDQHAVDFVRELRDRNIRVGLASSSKNAAPILERAGLSDLFEVVVDGKLSELLNLRGKPQPDIFLKCLELLTNRLEPRSAFVVEDAIAGVEAGHRGGFGLVLGVDRHDQSAALREHGADWVIRDFREISVESLFERFAAQRRVA